MSSSSFEVSVSIDRSSLKDILDIMKKKQNRNAAFEGKQLLFKYVMAQFKLKWHDMVNECKVTQRYVYMDLYLMRYTLQHVALCSRCSLMSECPSLLRQQCYSVNLRKSLLQLFWWCFVTFELSPLTVLWLSFNIEIVYSSRRKTDISTLSLELAGKWVVTILLDIWEVN